MRGESGSVATGEAGAPEPEEGTMPSYAIDSDRHNLTATGIVEQVFEWEETADGRRRPSDKPARNENTGMPLWRVEVIYVQETYGRKSTVTAKVLVDSPDEPKVAPLTPVKFTRLVVELRVKGGSLIEAWSADSLADGPKGVQRPTPSSDKAA